MADDTRADDDSGGGFKLDAGTDERIMLVSRDEQSLLVVSYKDVKACIASAFAYVSPTIVPLISCLMDRLFVLRELSHR
jgi:PAB-dependent poly(A)-specific ribonuclease subunit 3